MGVVFLAHDPRLERRIALKTIALPRGLSQERQDEFRERFLREARAAAALSHPGIVTIYDAGEDETDKAPYIAMEYVAGRTMRDLIADDEPLDSLKVASMIAELASALAAAHDAGIVHRDIKPANILIDEAGSGAKIADFGIARLSTSELTRVGESLGSPAYMSPEQVRGQEVCGTSDLFSLAVILYETLCGERPFNGKDPAALAYSVCHETPVPITKRAAGLSPELDCFFDRALAKKAEERFPDGHAFREALEQALSAAPNVDVQATIVQLAAAPAEPPPAPLASDFSASSSFTGEEERPVWWMRRNAMIALAVFGLIGGWLFFGSAGNADLVLDVKSAVESGRLVIQLDGEEVYSRELSGPRHKRNIFKKLMETNHETFEAWIEVPAGKHELVAEVIPEGQTHGYRDKIAIQLEPGETRRIRMVAGKAFGQALSVKDVGKVD